MLLEQQQQSIESYVKQLKTQAMIVLVARLCIYFVAATLVGTLFYVWKEKLAHYRSCQGFYAARGMPAELTGTQCAQYLSSIPW